MLSVKKKKLGFEVSKYFLKRLDSNILFLWVDGVYGKYVFLLL